MAINHEESTLIPYTNHQLTIQSLINNQFPQEFAPFHCHQTPSLHGTQLPLRAAGHAAQRAAHAARHPTGTQRGSAVAAAQGVQRGPGQVIE